MGGVSDDRSTNLAPRNLTAKADLSVLLWVTKMNGRAHMCLSFGTLTVLVRHFHPVQDYLARLEAIRKQNYVERRQIQQRMAGIRAPAEPKKVRILL